MGERHINMEGNFLEMYMNAVGRTEVPDQFHLWTALSLISACLENRVWVERMTYQRIYPNQYVFLIGDPACGKGTAIGIGRRVLEDMDRRGYALRTYRGALTRAALQDELAERWQEQWKAYEEYARSVHNNEVDEPTGVSLYFMAPELSSGTNVGPQAKDLIKLLTDFWEGDIGRYQERTRTSGRHEFSNPCINCLVGSAPEWCREVVDAKDLASGFWARVACVTGERDYDRRVARPDTSAWSDHLPILSWRLCLLMRKVDATDIAFEGPMYLSPEADAMDIDWYETRRAPSDRLFAAHWGRQPDQVLRIAMLLKFCDFFDLERNRSEDWRRIEASHWSRALELSNDLLRNAGTFLGESLSFTHNWKVARIEDIVKRRAPIAQRPDLLRLVSRYGIKSKDLEQALQALEDEMKVDRVTIGNGNFTVRWRDDHGRVPPQYVNGQAS